MKKLILLRHAKSSWSEHGLDDHDRPLNKRGKAAAPLVGAWLDARGHLPDRILSSTAKRAQDTYRRLRKRVPALPEADRVPALYHATPEGIVALLRAQDDRAAAVMVIGHEPGMSALARRLSAANAPERCARAFSHFPTAAAAVLEFDVDRWRDLAEGRGRFVDFAVPRELETA